jgi:AraC-like DNA-binding protein
MLAAMLFPSLELDRQLTVQVRLRRWAHRGPEERWKESYHPAVELALVHQGAITYRVGSAVTVVAGGEAMLVPAQHGHSNTIARGTVATSLHLAPELLAEIGLAMDRRPPADASLLPEPERLAPLLQDLEAEALDGERGSLLAVDALAEAIAVKILRRGRGPAALKGSTDPRLLAALELIETDYAEPLSVEAMARAAGMSRFHFSRSFRAAMKSSPYEYLIGVRVARAAEHLRSGRASVTEAALSVGFNDLGRFAAAFRQRVGLSPGAYLAVARQARARPGPDPTPTPTPTDGPRPTRSVPRP